MNIEKIHTICKKYKIENYTINDDLSIDVDSDVDLYNRGLIKLPLRFRNVNGYFYCTHNNLTTLNGAPSSVGSNFDCSWNKLKTLEGAPSSVGGGFFCACNYLKSLEGAKSSIGGFFDCDNNPLESLEGIPLNLYYDKLFLPFEYSHSDYLAYCRDLKFKKILNYK